MFCFTLIIVYSIFDLFNHRSQLEFDKKKKIDILHCIININLHSNVKADVLIFKCFRIDKKSVLTHPRFV